MCGIIGYTGYRTAQEVIIDCLQRLEYRGYDSAGIGIIDKKLQVFKEIGEISKLKDNLPQYKGNTGLGHTRWATHGNVTKDNAHPHVSSKQHIAIVHNGIIDNFKQLRDQLIKKGFSFKGQTDSEVIANLIDSHYTNNLEQAVYKATQQLKGSYALVAINKKEPKKIVGARNESPLVIGVGDNENFLASDIPALLKYTNRVIYLDDGELCVLDDKTIAIYDDRNKPLSKEEHIINWDIADAEKAGFPHFMLKEIYEQTQSIQQTLRGRISEIEQTITFPDKVEQLLKTTPTTIHVIACGTSLYAGMIGKYFIEQLTGIPVQIDQASEYRYFGNSPSGSLVVAITQSGETADTLAAIKKAKSSGLPTLVISNVIGSTATRIADGYVLMQCGPEIGVAATKTFTSQLILLYLLALKLAMRKETISADEIYKNIIRLKDLPRHIRSVLDQNEVIRDIATQHIDKTTMFFIGRGINFPLSLEGALKLKEISYLHAEGFAAGELKHGPFALLTKNTPVIALATQDDTYDKMLANIGEVKARGPQVIAVAEEHDDDIEKHADVVLRYSSPSKRLSCVPIAVLLQLFAYHVADLKQCPIDKPRNLAKSVTVE